jgi:hypothetical protein
MNWAWWDGKMTRHHYRDEHGLDSETLNESPLAEVELAAANHEEPEPAEVKHGR